MGPTLEALKRQIDDLEISDKAEILRMLVADLDKSADEGATEAWLQEAHRRHHELSSGAVTFRSGESGIREGT